MKLEIEQTAAGNGRQAICCTCTCMYWIMEGASKELWVSIAAARAIRMEHVQNPIGV